MSGSTFSEEMCHIIKWIILRGKLFEVAGYTFLCSYKFLAQKYAIINNEMVLHSTKIITSKKEESI